MISFAYSEFVGDSGEGFLLSAVFLITFRFPGETRKSSKLENHVQLLYSVVNSSNKLLCKWEVNYPRIIQM